MLASYEQGSSSLKYFCPVTLMGSVYITVVFYNEDAGRRCSVRARFEHLLLGVDDQADINMKLVSLSYSMNFVGGFPITYRKRHRLAAMISCG